MKPFCSVCACNMAKMSSCLRMLAAPSILKFLPINARSPIFFSLSAFRLSLPSSTASGSARSAPGLPRTINQFLLSLHREHCRYRSRIADFNSSALSKTAGPAFDPLCGYPGPTKTRPHGTKPDSRTDVNILFGIQIKLLGRDSVNDYLNDECGIYV